MKDQDLSPEALRAFARRFGDGIPNPKTEKLAEEQDRPTKDDIERRKRQHGGKK